MWRHVKLVKQTVNAKAHLHCYFFSAWFLARRRGRGGQGPYVDHADVNMHTLAEQARGEIH